MPLQIERDSGIRLLPRSRQNRDTLLLRYRTGRDWLRGIRYMRAFGTSLRHATACDSLPVSINTELTDFRQ